jgi:hypothetical protein
MFRPNETHRQQDFFGLETQLSPEIRKRLHESQEYAFYTQVFLRIPEALFADLYSQDEASRPNAPINTMVGAMILQHLKNWTYEELLDHLAFDLKVRAALGLWSLAEEPFCRSTLFNFQRRIRDHMVSSGQDKFQAVFDRLTEEDLERFGLKSSIQRSDSTQIGSNIRQYTRIELLVEVVLRMWRVLSEADQEKYGARFAELVGARTAGQFLYRLKKSEIDSTLERLGQLYAWMVETLESDYRDLEIYGIVCRVFAEQFALDHEKIVVRGVSEIASDSLQSPDDPEATFRRKDDEVFRGFVLHATETADPQNALQLITDVAVGPNNRDDSRILQERLEPMMQKTPDLQELHVDGAYGSEENDRVQAELGITVVQTGIRGMRARAPMRIEPLEGGLYQVTCAAGFQATSQAAWIRDKAEFDAAGCSGCPFAAICPAIPRKGGRSFYFTQADALRQARHRRLKELPPERQTLRANVEASMKEFKAPCRKGKLRTRGHAAAAQYGSLRAIAINFRRIYRHLRSNSDDCGLPTPVPPAGRTPATVFVSFGALDRLRGCLRRTLTALALPNPGPALRIRSF